MCVCVCVCVCVLCYFFSPCTCCGAVNTDLVSNLRRLQGYDLKMGAHHLDKNLEEFCVPNDII